MTQILFLFFNITVLVFLLVGIRYTYKLIDNNKGSTVVLSDFTLNGQPDDFHLRYLDKNSPKVYRFETTVSGSAIQNLKSDYYNLLVFRVSDNSYNVYFNDNIIGTVGDPKTIRNYFWTSLHYFNIERSLVKETNTVAIEIFPAYKVGKSNFPILITTPDAGYTIFNRINTMFQRTFEAVLNMLIYGSLLFLAFLLISGRFNRDSIIYLLAAFFVSLYMLNYTAVYNLPISVYALKKIQYASLFTGTSIASLAIYYEYRRKINLIFGLSLLPAIVLTLFTPDALTVTNKLNILVFLNLLGWLYTSLINFRKDYTAKAFLVASTFLFIYLCYDYYTVFTGQSEIVQLSNYGIINYILAFFLINSDNYFEYQNSLLRRSIEAEKEKEMLHRQACTDGLTSLYNQRYFYEYFNEIIGRTPQVTMLFCDIDNFKSINDTFGHLIGDAILKEIGRIMKAEAPGDSPVFRYGGEEFVVLIDGSDINQCLKHAERIRLSIRDSKVLKQHTNQTPVTITIGLASYPGHVQTAADLLNKADKAMYYGKLHGKNRSVIYSPEMENTIRC